MSLEKFDRAEDENLIEISRRLIEGDEIAFRVLNYSFKVNGEKYLLEVGRALQAYIRLKGI